MKYFIIAYICAISGPECSEQNQIDTVVIPAHSAQDCMLTSQMSLAQHPDLISKEQKVRITCKYK